MISLMKLMLFHFRDDVPVIIEAMAFAGEQWGVFKADMPHWKHAENTD